MSLFVKIFRSQKTKASDATMKPLTIGLLGLMTASLLSCAPPASQLKKVLEENPDIIFNVMEKHPKKFMEALRSTNEKAMEQSQADELEDAFKNPSKAEVQENRVVFGNKSAPITIVEYSDFLCPYCEKAYKTMKQIHSEYGDKVRLVYKHLPFKQNAEPAARYYEAIGLQDPKKAEEFHDYLYANQGTFHAEGEAFLKKAAKFVGADMKKLQADFKADNVSQILTADMREAEKNGFRGTPGFLVGKTAGAGVEGVPVHGAYPIEHFRMIIDRYLKAN